MEVVETYQREATYEVVSSSLSEEWDPEKGIYHVIFEVTIKNIDRQGGWFWMSFHGVPFFNSTYIDLGATATVKIAFEDIPGIDHRLQMKYITEHFHHSEYITPPLIPDQRLVTRNKTLIEILIHGT